MSEEQKGANLGQSEVPEPVLDAVLAAAELCDLVMVDLASVANCEEGEGGGERRGMSEKKEGENSE